MHCTVVVRSHDIIIIGVLDEQVLRDVAIVVSTGGEDVGFDGAIEIEFEQDDAEGVEVGGGVRIGAGIYEELLAVAA